jgi:hypothetical protein
MEAGPGHDDRLEAVWKTYRLHGGNVSFLKGGYHASDQS